MINKLKIFAFLVAFLWSQTALCNDISYLAAIYVDTLNKINIKGGFVFNEPYKYNENRPHYGGSFKYTDIECGEEGTKLTVGFGENVDHGLDRLGLSYAMLKSQNLVGIEAITSQMGMSFKFGWYYGLKNTQNRWLLGIGFGF